MNFSIALMLLFIFSCSHQKSDQLHVQSEGSHSVIAVKHNQHQDIQGAEKALQKVERATLALWVKASGQITRPQTLVHVSVGTSRAARAALRILPGGQLHGEARAGDNELAQHARSAAAVTTQEWYHVALTIDYAKNEMIFYLNGEPIPTSGLIQFQSSETSNTPSMEMLAGPFEGEIQDVKIMGRRLLAVEIRKLEANSRPFMR